MADPAGPLRIAYVINSLEGGGAALPVPLIARVLRDNGAELRILALTLRDGRALGPMQTAGLDVRVRVGGRRDHLHALRWLDREVAAFAPTHLWTSLTHATLFGQLVGLRRRIPVVSWQHAAWLRPGNRRMLAAMQRLSVLWIGDSERVTQLTRTRLGVPPQRLMRWSLFAADPGAPQARAWQPGETVRVGSLGRLHPVKGYDVLIEALALIARDGLAGETRFEVTLAGDGGARDELQALAAARGITNLRFSGFSAHPQEVLAGLHVYVQPSRSEGLCVAAHEAMQAGLAVVASTVGELPFTIEDGVSGRLVPPADAAALAAALGDILRSPQQLAAMGTRARDRVLLLFGREAFEATGAAIVARLRGVQSAAEARAPWARINGGS